MKHVKPGEVTTMIDKEKYSVGFVNGHLCVWTPEVGVEDLVVTIDDLPQSWSGEPEDLEHLLLHAKSLCTSHYKGRTHSGIQGFDLFLTAAQVGEEEFVVIEQCTSDTRPTTTRKVDRACLDQLITNLYPVPN